MVNLHIVPGRLLYIHWVARSDEHTTTPGRIGLSVCGCQRWKVELHGTGSRQTASISTLRIHCLTHPTQGSAADINVQTDLKSIEITGAFFHLIAHQRLHSRC